MFFNLHTHYYNMEEGREELAIVNCYPNDSLPQGTPCSVGLHPWYIGEDWHEQLALVNKKVREDAVWAVGECGLDKLCGVDFEIQKEVFGEQLAIARAVGKPVIVHCVKAYNELLAMISGKDKVIVHGFRGKPQLAKQIMTKGALLSFGHLYNVETLRFVYSTYCPFFLETDDCHLSIRQIYEEVGCRLGVDVGRLGDLCDFRRICEECTLLKA